MYHVLYTLRGYAHLYRSLLRFCGISSFEAKELCFLLNLANIDTHIALTGDEQHEYNEREFSTHMNRYEKTTRPYHTEVQLYKSMEALECSIDFSKITDELREAVMRLRCFMENIEFSFYKSFSIDITDEKTVYALCAKDLIPRESEPSVCLFSDWKALLPALFIARGKP